MISIGITGGIGSGKTTVAKFFNQFGIPIYIADDEAKKLMHKSPIKEEVLELFGAESYTSTGTLNRSFISNQVFDNKELLDQLNAIVHPRVQQHYKNWVNAQKAPYILYEAAILFETGRYKDFDYNILVTAPEKERINRIKKRDKTTEQQIKARMKNQWPDSQKIELANWVIQNKNLTKTEEEVQKLHRIILYI